MLEQLDDCDWAEAFCDESSGNTTKEINAFGCSDAPFFREDVAEIIAIYKHEGDYAECDVCGLFRLHDGRFATVTGWCDTTGWDCQAGNSLTVANTLEQAIAMGLTQSNREELGLLSAGNEGE